MGKVPRASVTQGVKQRRPKPLYKSFVFWLALLMGVGVAGPLTRAYRFWQEADANLPIISDALTFERTGTITIKDDNGSTLQKIGPATQEYLQYDHMPDTWSKGLLRREIGAFTSTLALTIRAVPEPCTHMFGIEIRWQRAVRLRSSLHESTF